VPGFSWSTNSGKERPERSQDKGVGDDAERVGVELFGCQVLLHVCEATLQLGSGVARGGERPHHEGRVADQAGLEGEELGLVPLPRTVCVLLAQQPVACASDHGLVHRLDLRHVGELHQPERGAHAIL